MKKSELKQLIREAIEAEMNRKNSSIDVVKNIINNEFSKKLGINVEVDKTKKFILFPKGQENIPEEVMDVVIKFAPNTKILTVDGRRAIEFL
jgi:hypothetical protein